MRTLKLHFAADALPTLETFLKRTKEARVFRRAQAVRAVVTGQRLQTVSDTLHFTYSALRKWVYRFASHGAQGLGRSLALRATAQSHVRAGAAPQSPGRSRPPGARFPVFPMELSGPRGRLSSRNQGPTRP